jgi:hypothetical protein
VSEITTSTKVKMQELLSEDALKEDCFPAHGLAPTMALSFHI